jgi:hypothetical protein
MTDEDKNTWQEGFDCADIGGSESANTYPRSSSQHLAWNDGYAAFFFDQQEQ